MPECKDGSALDLDCSWEEYYNYMGCDTSIEPTVYQGSAYKIK
ncbi:MAG: hypothetical protein ACE5J4_00375 [Candidatus Aenigmatarchaeota archaeon]